MCAARPAARSLLLWSLTTASAPSISARAISIASCHHFHSSAQLARRKSRFKSVRAEQMGLVDEASIDRFARSKFPEYTEDEKDDLPKSYSREQIAALEAGEAAIDPKDLATQGRLRLDQYRLRYIDDFKEIQPILDKRPRTMPAADPNARWLDPSEFGENLMNMDKDREKFAEGNKEFSKMLGDDPEYLKMLEQESPEASETIDGPTGNEKLQDPSDALWDETKFMSGAVRQSENGSGLGVLYERSGMTGGDYAGAHSSLAPALPRKVPGVAGLYKAAIDPADEGLDDAGVYRDLKKQTGMSVRQIMDVTTKTLVSRFVSNQTRLGKIRSASVIVCAGNRNGWLGIGMAKSTEVSIANTKARMLAIRNMRPIPRYENRTIYGNTEAKVGATIVQLYTRPPGFGLRVSHRIFEMCRAAGIWDLSARMPRARNPMNSVKATYEALMKQADPNEIARGRGKKLVDARKVYYGGAVY